MTRHGTFILCNNDIQHHCFYEPLYFSLHFNYILCVRMLTRTCWKEFSCEDASFEMKLRDFMA